MYPCLESCSCGGWLALSSQLGPTAVDVVSHLSSTFCCFYFNVLPQQSVVVVPSEGHLQLGQWA